MTGPAESRRITTFYSYKGGTGRSMALANVAWILASNGKRVLAIDWDLEAPGLHRYFHPFLSDPDLKASPGVIDFVLDFAMAAVTPDDGPSDEEWFFPYANILRYAKSLQYPFPGKGTIDFVPAGQQGPEYATRVNSFDWQHFYEELGGGVFLEAARERMLTYDYVLIDSRTGVSDTSGICTVQLPDQVVLCFTLNSQSIQGAAAVAESIMAQRQAADGPTIRVFPVPTSVEKAEHQRVERRRSEARQRFRDLVRRLKPPSEEEYWAQVEVRYEPFYAYEEVLATFGDEPNASFTMLAAMEKLTAFVTGGEVAAFPALPEEERRAQLARFVPPEPVAGVLEAVPVADSGVHVLSQGARGDEVRRWQHAIGETEDGVFGSATTRATKRWQQAHGLVADGIVGARTWEAYFALRVESIKVEQGELDYWVFVSWHALEGAPAERFVADLRKRMSDHIGNNVQFFLGRDALVAEQFEAQVTKCLVRSRVGLSLISPRYLSSGRCRTEFASMVALGSMPIIPVLWEQAEPSGLLGERDVLRIEGVEDISTALRRLSRYAEQYEEFVSTLAARIVEAGRAVTTRHRASTNGAGPPRSPFEGRDMVFCLLAIGSSLKGELNEENKPWPSFEPMAVRGLVSNAAGVEELTWEIIDYSEGMARRLAEMSNPVVVVADTLQLSAERFHYIKSLSNGTWPIIACWPDRPVPRELAGLGIQFVSSEDELRRALATAFAEIKVRWALRAPPSNAAPLELAATLPVISGPYVAKA